MGQREYDAAVAEAAEALIKVPEWIMFVQAVSARALFLASNPSDDLSLEASHLAKTLPEGSS